MLSTLSRSARINEHLDDMPDRTAGDGFASRTSTLYLTTVSVAAVAEDEPETSALSTAMLEGAILLMTPCNGVSGKASTLTSTGMPIFIRAASISFTSS